MQFIVIQPIVVYWDIINTNVYSIIRSFKQPAVHKYIKQMLCSGDDAIQLYCKYDEWNALLGQYSV